MSVNDPQLSQPDPVDFDKQTTGQTTRPKMPPTGEYTLVVTQIDTRDPITGNLLTTRPAQDGSDGGRVYFQPTLTFRVVDPGQPHDNYEMRYQRVSVKKWPKKESNSALDYLRAHGIAARPTTNEEYESLILQTLNRPFRAMLDWNAYDSATKEARRGMIAFPKRDDGTFQPWFTATGGGDTKVFANTQVKFYKDAVAA